MIDETHAALREFYIGNPEPYKKQCSDLGDVSLLGAFGGVSVGPNEVTKHLTTRASFFRGGRNVTFESKVKFSDGDFGYTVEIERFDANVGGTEGVHVVLRVTTIFRREDGSWKVAHRIGDPLVAMIDPPTYRSLAKRNEEMNV